MERVVRIEKVVAGGLGLGRMEGRVIFVRGALPDEEVRVRVDGIKPGYAEGRLLEVRESSPRRVKPECPYYGACGGCNLMHAEYEYQLDLKAGIVVDAFRRIGGVHIEPPPAAPSKPFGYRHRLQVHRGPSGRPGFKSIDGVSVVEIDRCLVACDAFNSLIKNLRFSDDRERVEILCTDNECHLAGRAEVTLSVGDTRFAASPTAFFQNNLGMLGELVDRVGAAATGETAIDLYGGIGLFSRFLGASFKRVILVESDTEAASFARRNTPANVEVVRQSVEGWLSGSGAGIHADFVVADPPRSGLSPAALKGIVLLNPAMLRYLSCNPVTLARDLGRLCASGYQLLNVAVLDLYPQTSHVETLCTFGRG